MKRKLICLFIVLVLSVSFLASTPAQADTLNEATIRVKTQADYLAAIYSEAPYEWCSSVSAMNYVSNYISPRLYNYYRTQEVAITDVDMALEYGAGICGTQTMVFCAIMQQFSIPYRTVQCFNIDEIGSNHIFAETYYNEKWNAFDSTIGAYWHSEHPWETLSFDEARALPDHSGNLTFNRNNIFYMGMTGAGYDPFAHLTSATVEIVYGETNGNPAGASSVPYTPPAIPSCSGGIPTGTSYSPGIASLSYQDSRGKLMEDVECFTEDMSCQIYLPKKTVTRNALGQKLPSIMIKTHPISDGDASPVYELWPEGATFNPGVVLTLRTPAHWSPDSFQVMAKAGENWLPVESIIVKDGLGVEVTRFTSYKLVMKPYTENDWREFCYQKYRKYF